MLMSLPGVVVELDVAVAVVRAGGPCVACDPGLVPERPRRGARVDGQRPGQAAVGRAVDEQDVATAPRVDPEPECEPHVVVWVVRDRRVADPRPGPGWSRLDGRAGQAAGRPRPATVLRRREDEVARPAAAEVAARLGERHDRLPVRIGVRLQLRLVLVARRAVRVRVVADGSRDHAPGGDGRGEEQREHNDRERGPDRPRTARSVLPHDGDVNPFPGKLLERFARSLREPEAAARSRSAGCACGREPGRDAREPSAGQ